MMPQTQMTSVASSSPEIMPIGQVDKDGAPIFHPGAAYAQPQRQSVMQQPQQPQQHTLVQMTNKTSTVNSIPSIPKV